MEKYDKEFQRYWLCYENEDGEALFLEQFFNGNDVLGNITSDTQPMEEISINGNVGYYTEDKESGTIVFNDGTYMVMIYGNLSKEILIKLAEELELEP